MSAATGPTGGRPTGDGEPEKPGPHAEASTLPRAVGSVPPGRELTRRPSPHGAARPAGARPLGAPRIECSLTRPLELRALARSTRAGVVLMAINVDGSHVLV